MIYALISFSLCSGVLLGIYHLLLKGKTLYQFNRYYLLFSLLFSLAVPFIGIKTSVPIINAIKPAEENIILLPATEPQQVAKQLLLPVHDNTPAARIIHQKNWYWQYGLLALYIAVSLVLLTRFARNLYLVNTAIKSGERHFYKSSQLVLTANTLTPHTFLRFIFLNRDDYRNQTIDPAILKHELTHARELHSIDIILIELLQAACWFNPFIFLYRKAIELNHEFIADAAAIGHATDRSAYQYLLLNTVANTSGLSITSQFNYLTIKKRLIMMNRSTTAAKALLAKAAIVPVFVAAFLLFCDKTEVFAISPAVKSIKQSKTEKTTVGKDTAVQRKFEIGFITSDYPCTKEGIPADELKEYQQILSKYEVGPDSDFMFHMKITDEDRTKLETIFKKMSRKQQAQQRLGFSYPATPLPPKSPTQADINIWKNPRACGVWIDGKKVDNAVLNNYKPADFGMAYASRLSKNNINYKKYKYQVDLYTVAYYDKIYKQDIADQYKSHMFFKMRKVKV